MASRRFALRVKYPPSAQAVEGHDLPPIYQPNTVDMLTTVENALAQVGRLIEMGAQSIEMEIR